MLVFLSTKSALLMFLCECGLMTKVVDVFVVTCRNDEDHFMLSWHQHKVCTVVFENKCRFYCRCIWFMYICFHDRVLFSSATPCHHVDPSAGQDRRAKVCTLLVKPTCCRSPQCCRSPLTHHVVYIQFPDTLHEQVHTRCSSGRTIFFLWVSFVVDFLSTYFVCLVLVDFITYRICDATQMPSGSC